MKKIFSDATAVVAVSALIATPAMAGAVIPAPVAGVGLGALVILAIGYRALRKHIDG